VSAWGAVIHQAQVRVVNDAIRDFGAQQVLEVAPGPARLSCDVVGFQEGILCDANESMLRIARQRLSRQRSGAAGGRWSLVQGDGFRLPFAGPFDLIYTFRFIRHFELHDRAALYAQIRSLLREGGIFILDAVNVVTSLPLRAKEGLNKYPVYDELYQRDDLVKELNAHGFEVLSLTDVLRHATWQQKIQIYVAPRSHGLAKGLMELLEHVPGQPLEWVITCRKKPCG
jgi:SAM-dependent methyltransferase